MESRYPVCHRLYHRCQTTSIKPFKYQPVTMKFLTPVTKHSRHAAHLEDTLAVFTVNIWSPVNKHYKLDIFSLKFQALLREKLSSVQLTFHHQASMLFHIEKSDSTCIGEPLVYLFIGCFGHKNQQELNQLLVEFGNHQPVLENCNYTDIKLYEKFYWILLTICIFKGQSWAFMYLQQWRFTFGQAKPTQRRLPCVIRCQTKPIRPLRISCDKLLLYIYIANLLL